MRRLVGPPVLFVAGVLLLQLAWTVTIPPFRGSDEFDHVYRAASVASGEWLSEEPAVDGRGALVSVPATLVEAAREQCQALDYVGPDNCVPVDGSSGRVVTIASSAYNYNPAFYWAIGSIAKPFGGVAALYVMRATSSVLCAIFLLLGAIAIGRAFWMRLAYLLALSPVVVYSSTVVAPNGLEMAAGTALWASLLALSDKREEEGHRALIGIALAAAVVLMTVRLLGPLMLLLIAGSMIALGGSTIVQRLLAQRRLVVAGMAVLGTVGAADVAWILFASQTAAPADVEGDPTNLNPLRVIVWAAQTIAAFPFRNQPGPLLVYVTVGSLVAAMWFVAMRTGTRRSRAVLVAVTLVSILGPVLLTEFTKDSQGVIWQGRYGLPYSVGLVLVAGAVLSKHVRPVGRVLCAIFVGALGMGTAACLLKIRADELMRAPSAQDDSWLVPTPLTLLGLVLVATSLQFAWLFRAGRPMRGISKTASDR